MVNKKGWVRIVEASIAVVLIMSVAAIVTVNRQGFQQEDLTNDIRSYLEEISRSNELREEILSEDKSGVETFLNEKITNPLIMKEIVICSIDNLCALNPYPVDAENNEIYSAERIISINPDSPDTVGSKKIKIYLWIKQS